MITSPNVHIAALGSSEEFHAVKMQPRHSKRLPTRETHTFSILIQRMLSIDLDYIIWGSAIT